MTKIPLQKAIITIVPKMPMLTDKKTKVQSLSVPFYFADGVRGFITITKLAPLGWAPSDELEDITIKFKV